MAHFELSQAQLAKKTGIGQSTLSTILDSKTPLETNPRCTTIELLAGYFQIPSWQLLIPDLPLDLLMSPELTKILENYRDAPPEGRQTIYRIAESEVRYSVLTPHKLERA